MKPGLPRWAWSTWPKAMVGPTCGIATGVLLAAQDAHLFAAAAEQGLAQAQNMAPLRWLTASFEGVVVLVAAAHNAGERAVERYRGVPPYAETRHDGRKILAAMGNQVSRPFDPKVTAPSSMLPAMREAPRPRS
jgi:hypothetical protein